jgi:hypothetical protein
MDFMHAYRESPVEEFYIWLQQRLFSRRSRIRLRKNVSALHRRFGFPLPSDGCTCLTHHTPQACPSVEVWKCETEFHRITLGRAGQETYADNTDPIGLNKNNGE